MPIKEEKRAQLIGMFEAYIVSTLMIATANAKDQLKLSDIQKQAEHTVRALEAFFDAYGFPVESRREPRK